MAKQLDCKHERKTDLTNGLGDRSVNIYCPDCGWHYYNDREWTAKEWFDYVNKLD
jgi:hypothetical protein